MYKNMKVLKRLLEREPAPSREAALKSSPPGPTARVFISYRRDDSADIAGRINDRLIGMLGADAVFKDVDSIPLGVDYRSRIEESLSYTDVFLPIVGPNWLSITDSDGQRRLDDASDIVRMEVESALSRGITTIPLVVSGATMPRPDELPEAIRPLASYNGLSIRPDPDFEHDMERLAAALTLK